MHQMIHCCMLSAEQLPLTRCSVHMLYLGDDASPLRLITAILNHVAHYALMEGDARGLGMR